MAHFGKACSEPLPLPVLIHLSTQMGSLRICITFCSLSLSFNNISQYVGWHSFFLRSTWWWLNGCSLVNLITLLVWVWVCTRASIILEYVSRCGLARLLGSCYSLKAIAKMPSKKLLYHFICLLIAHKRPRFFHTLKLLKINTRKKNVIFLFF